MKTILSILIVFLGQLLHSQSLELSITDSYGSKERLIIKCYLANNSSDKYSTTSKLQLGKVQNEEFVDSTFQIYFFKKNGLPFRFQKIDFKNLPKSSVREYLIDIDGYSKKEIEFNVNDYLSKEDKISLASALLSEDELYVKLELHDKNLKKTISSNITIIKKK